MGSRRSLHLDVDVMARFTHPRPDTRVFGRARKRLITDVTGRHRRCATAASSLLAAPRSDPTDRAANNVAAAAV